MRTPLTLLLLGSLTLTACGGTNTAATPAAGTGDQAQTAEDAAMLRLVNEARSQSRVCGSERFAAAAPLTWNARLATAAQVHAADMAGRNYFSHTSPEGRTARHRAEAAGYTGWLALGENLHAGSTTPAGAMQAWLDSEGHCKALMNPGFRELGAASVNRPGSEYGTYWVQVFGSR